MTRPFLGALSSLLLSGCIAGVPGSGPMSNRTTWSMTADAVGCVGVNDDDGASTVRVYLRPSAGYGPGDVVFTGSACLPPGRPIVVRTSPQTGLPPSIANLPPQYSPYEAQEILGNAERALDACIRGGGGTGNQVLGSAEGHAPGRSSQAWAKGPSTVGLG